MTEAINEGIEIENEKHGEKRKLLTSKQVGRILTEVGPSNLTEKIEAVVSGNVQIDGISKNALPTKNQTENQIFRGYSLLEQKCSALRSMKSGILL